MKQKRLKKWQATVEDFSNSGLSSAEFCQRAQISQGSLYRYRKIFSPESIIQPPKAKPKPKVNTKENPTTTPTDKIEVVDITNRIEKQNDASPTLRLTSASGVVLEIFL